MHYKDTERTTTDPKPDGDCYRLFGVDDDGNTYFYWSKTAGEFAAYYGPRYPAVWGTLICKNTMLPKHKVFIEDIQMVRKLEKLTIMQPCHNCNYSEWKRWKEASENS